MEYYLKNIFAIFFLAVQHYAVMSKNNASDSGYKIAHLFYISIFIFILLNAGKDMLLEISKDKKNYKMRFLIKTLSVNLAQIHITLPLIPRTLLTQIATKPKVFN